jgi:glycosyltransferase involved in cell wall biosynthesis
VKILFVTYSAYPRIGGRSTYMTLLKQQLEKMEHHVDILAHAPGLNDIYLIGQNRQSKASLRQMIESKIERVHHSSYPFLTPWIKMRETERYLFGEALRSFPLEQYDLIHTQDLISTLAVARTGVNVPCLASFHNSKVEEWKVNQTLWDKEEIEIDYIAREEYLSLSRTQKAIVPSQWLEKAFTKLGISPSKMKMVRYGLDTVALRQLARRTAGSERKPADRPLILCPARLVGIKGHTYLFQALQMLKNEGIPFTCWVAGNGVLEQRLKREVEERGIGEDVRFLGGRADVPALLYRADITVLPSLHDTFPFVIMESQLLGTPVVATNVGGIPEMIENDKTGLLGPAQDAAYLYSALKRLIQNQAYARILADEARRRAERRWTAERMAQQTVAVYEEVMSQYAVDHELLAPLRSGQSPKNRKRLCGRIIWKKREEENTVVSIHLLDLSWITLKSTTCDPEGAFSFGDVPEGKYALMAVWGENTATYYVDSIAEEVLWEIP